MLDLSLFLVVIGMFVLGLRRPFIWVLAYIYIDVLIPQQIGWTLTPMLPISLIAAVLSFLGWLAFESKQNARFTLRQGLLLALLCWCFATLQWADYPENAAEKWDWVWKALLFALFLPLTLVTRLRIEAAALIMTLTAGAIIISGGMKTALGGGGYGSLSLFVNSNSNIYESSTLATVAIALIPLIAWFMKHGTIFQPDWRVKSFGALLILSCLLIPIGTEARTGLVCLAVLAVLILREVKHRMIYVAAAGAIALVAMPFLPQSYYERMGLITGHTEDQSASTRLQVWEWTWDYAKENPLGGGFDSYRGNSFAYDLPVVTQEGNTTSVEIVKIEDESRAFHSSIFEMLGEQGWPGLILWTWLHLAGIWQMGRLRRNWRASHPDGWQWPLAVALQMAQIIYLVGSLFQGIAYQPFVLLLVGLQCGLWSYLRRVEPKMVPETAAGSSVEPAHHGTQRAS